MTLDPNMKVCANSVPKTLARAIAFIEKNGLPPDVKRTKKHAKNVKNLRSQLCK
jgi:hypothetical protein